MVYIRSGQPCNSQLNSAVALALQACDPQNYAKVHKKPRCPCPGCREKLTSINTYRCKVCGLEVCLKHRFPSDHTCSGRPSGG